MTTRLADHTTLRVGGPAKDFLVADTEQQVVEVLARLDADGAPVLLLGGGSNLVCSDEGFDGTVVALRIRGLAIADHPDHVVMTAACGEPWSEVVSLAVSNGWAGIEAMAGIPGLVGATPVQNVGAYGQDVSQTIAGVRAYDRLDGLVRDLTPERCGFTYRGSAFKAEPDRWAVLAVSYRLAKTPSSAVRYAQLADELGVGHGEASSVSAIRDAVLRLRRGKGMVLDDADPDSRSAGSFFTNPIVSMALSSALPTDCPRYPSSDGVKLSAAWLIEQAGIPRGWQVRTESRARVSTKHTLALTTRDGAAAADVLELARHIRGRVRAAFGVELQPEPQLVGCVL